MYKNLNKILNFVVKLGTFWCKPLCDPRPWKEYHLGSSILMCNLFYTPSNSVTLFMITKLEGVLNENAMCNLWKTKTSK